MLWTVSGDKPVPEPISVMHLRASNFVGGPEKQILEHFARLDPVKFRPVLGTFIESGNVDPLGEEASARGFETIQFPSLSPLNPASIHHLATVMKRVNISLLCTHGYKPNILGCMAAALTRKANIAVSRGWTWENPRIKFYEAMDRRFLRLCNHVVAVSLGQQEKILASGVRPEKVSVIHNAINLADIPAPPKPLLRRQLGLPGDAILVASAGRLSPEKNYGGMIDAAVIAAAANPKLYFVVFGEGFLRPKLEAKIAAAGLEGRFLLPGFRNNLQMVMHEIDIFMLPSFTEGLPNVALEAFAVRKPIVATRVGGTPEVVEDGVSGYLTKPEEHDLMAHHLIRLAASPALRRTMGDTGYEYIKSEFGFEKQTREYEKLYETVVRH